MSITHMNEKTPIMYLQELLVHEDAPTYDISKADAHGMFQCTVTARKAKVIATASTKKSAKQEAARLMLLHLGKNVQVYPVSIQQSSNILKDNINNVLAVNYVGKLQEHCMAKNLNPPIFTLINVSGMDHEKSFTMECKTDDVTKKATAATKKGAKHAAAELVYEYYNIPGDDHSINHTKLQTTLKDMRIDIKNDKPIIYFWKQLRDAKWTPELENYIAKHKYDETHKQNILKKLNSYNDSMNAVLFIEQLLDLMKLNFNWGNLLIPTKDNRHIFTLKIPETTPPTHIPSYDGKDDLALKAINYMRLRADMLEIFSE